MICGVRTDVYLYQADKFILKTKTCLTSYKATFLIDFRHARNA